MDDIYYGIGGAYVLNPKTGERVPAPEAEPVAQDTPAAPVAEPKTTSKE